MAHKFGQSTYSLPWRKNAAQRNIYPLKSCQIVSATIERGGEDRKKKKTEEVEKCREVSGRTFAVYFIWRRRGRSGGPGEALNHPP